LLAVVLVLIVCAQGALPLHNALGPVAATSAADMEQLAVLLVEHGSDIDLRTPDGANVMWLANQETV
jgi:hypothetical protein